MKAKAIYKKNTLGKYAIDFLGKKALHKRAKRRLRQQSRKLCKSYIG